MTTYYCTECNGTDVYMLAYVHMNNYGETETTYDDDIICRDCGKNVIVREVTR